MSHPSSRSIRTLTRDFLQQSVIAGARRVIANRDHLDRINVFPVPDRDTGTNLALTMRAIVDGLQQPFPSLAAVSSSIASSALTGAQGNSGVIFAQFFQGLREGFSDSVQVSACRFAEALRRASTRSREALAQPREGTILTVISDVAEHLSRHAERLPDFKALLDEVGFEPDRVHFAWVSAAEGARFADLVREVTDRVRTLGPARRLVRRFDEGAEHAAAR